MRKTLAQRRRGSATTPRKVFDGSELGHQFPQPRGGLVAVNFPGGDIEGEMFPGGMVRQGRCAIQLKEGQTGRERRSLVSVHEGMVLAQADQIRRHHFREVGVNGLPAKGRLWGENCGFQKTGFPHAIAAAELSQHALVNRPDLAHVEVDTVVGRFHASLLRVEE